MAQVQTVRELTERVKDTFTDFFGEDLVQYGPGFSGSEDFPIIPNAWDAPYVFIGWCLTTSTMLYILKHPQGRQGDPPAAARKEPQPCRSTVSRWSGPSWPAWS